MSATPFASLHPTSPSPPFASSLLPHLFLPSRIFHSCPTKITTPPPANRKPFPPDRQNHHSPRPSTSRQASSLASPRSPSPHEYNTHLLDDFFSPRRPAFFARKPGFSFLTNVCRTYTRPIGRRRRIRSFKGSAQLERFGRSSVNQTSRHSGRLTQTRTHTHSHSRRRHQLPPEQIIAATPPPAFLDEQSIHATIGVRISSGE